MWCKLVGGDNSMHHKNNILPFPYYCCYYLYSTQCSINEWMNVHSSQVTRFILQDTIQSINGGKTLNSEQYQKGAGIEC